MPTIVPRDRAVTLLDSTWSAIAAFYASLDDADYDVPTACPGWTVRDQLSHLSATERSLLGEPMPDVDVSGATHVKNDIGGLNELWVEAMRPLPGPEVLDVWRSVTAARLEVLRAMTQEDFDAPSWTPAGPDETYGRFMRIRHYDGFVHEHDSREAVGAPNRDDPEAIRFCLEEVASALGFIVGRRAGIPSGHHVRIDLTGVAATTYLVEVSDRARLVDSFDADATIGIAMPTQLFLRLTAGRRETEPHLGSEITLSGETPLAQQLATNLAFTI